MLHVNLFNTQMSPPALTREEKCRPSRIFFKTMRLTFFCLWLAWCTCAQVILAAPFTLARKDALPDLPGTTSSYLLNRLPASNERFLLSRELLDRSLPGGANPLKLWVSAWNGEPLTGELPDQAIAGRGDWAIDATGTHAALIVVSPAPEGTNTVETLLVFRDLSLVARYPLKASNTWIASVSPQGHVVCRSSVNPTYGYIFTPGKPASTRAYPSLFLNWDYLSGAAVYAADRAVTVLGADKKPVMNVTVPFPVANATLFEDGSLLVGSQPIGGGPRWRILFDKAGKQLGESVFREWTQLPEFVPLKDTEDPATTPRTRQSSPYLMSVEQSGIEIRYRQTLAIGDRLPVSNTLRPQFGFDAAGHLYTLMNRRHVGGTTSEQIIQRSILFPPGAVEPDEMLTSADVARDLGWKSAIIYSMTVAMDGRWLAVTATPDDTRHGSVWWLLQYRLAPPEKNTVEQ